MKVRKNNFIWLFAFADLAFLLLISFTQIPNTRLQKIPLPKVPQKNGEALMARAQTSMKLFIFAADPPETGKSEPRTVSRPFQLVTFQGATKTAETPRLEEAQLVPALKERFEPDLAGPVVWPHPSARAEDLLTAYVCIQQVWLDQEVVIAVTPREGSEKQTP